MFISLGLLWIMPPILQTSRTPTIRILFCLSLLRQMSLTICDHFSHVINIILFILLGVFLGVFLQDFNDLPATIRPQISLSKVGWLRGGNKRDVPFMSNSLTRTIILTPASTLGVFILEPGVKFCGGHVHKIVKLS